MFKTFNLKTFKTPLYKTVYIFIERPFRVSWFAETFDRRENLMSRAPIASEMQLQG